MTKEDKELLLKDLCARLPYRVFMGNKEWNRRSYQLTCDEIQYAMMTDDWDDVPYLRPMSSMTEEEESEYHGLCYPEWNNGGWDGGNWHYHNTISSIDWLSAHHFDYRNLIDKGLAIEVTEDNNPYKE